MTWKIHGTTIAIPMDPAVPSERKWDWGMMTVFRNFVSSQEVGLDP